MSSPRLYNPETDKRTYRSLTDTLEERDRNLERFTAERIDRAVAWWYDPQRPPVLVLRPACDYCGQTMPSMSDRGGRKHRRFCDDCTGKGHSQRIPGPSRDRYLRDRRQQNLRQTLRRIKERQAC